MRIIISKAVSSSFFFHLKIRMINNRFSRLKEKLTWLIFVNVCESICLFFATKKNEKFIPF
jgi:hypothetical protein